ncbi:MAG: ribonuclease HII [Deltaproteobacteria bacterium]|nr:ribonuclease HII [Deltaproteobacteria bacterium]
MILPQLTVEQTLWRQGFQIVAGVDEVGMGPLAGPVVAAAVVFPAAATLDTLPRGVRDSKTLSAQARERLEPEIRRVAIGVGIGLVEVEEIDRINIYHAGRKAMRLALAAMPIVPEHVLIDGRALLDLPYPQRAFVKGDRDIYSIAAASIVAKVYRDHLMAELHTLYPQYGFAKHRGYGTAAHRDALRQFGPCPAHRRSFRLL